MKGVQSIVKATSKDIKESATVKDLIMSTLKTTVGAVFGETVDHVAFKLIKMRINQNDDPTPNSTIVVPKLVQASSGINRRS